MGQEDDLDAVIQQLSDRGSGERHLMVRVIAGQRIVEDNDRAVQQTLACEERREPEGVELAIAEYTNGIADLGW